jgi:hypothetical protein
MDRNLIAPSCVLLLALLVCVACILRMRALRSKNYGRWLRVAEMIVFTVVVLVAVALGSGATFNVVATQYFFAHHPVPGIFTMSTDTRCISSVRAKDRQP